jgi:ubiquinone/menaquinone biosynthesis C-methylase UbiE
MYKRINSCFSEHINGKILGISGIENFYSLFSKKAEIIEVCYPDVDMQNLPYADASFDVVISDQVIEHLENPTKAVRETYRVLKKGGLTIHTTCFLNAIHEYPKDYWRFSPDALSYLCKDFSEVIQCEGWGNRLAILLCFLGSGFRMMTIPERKWSLRRLLATWNEVRYPIVSWVIARK